MDRDKVVKLIRGASVAISNQWEGATGYVTEQEAVRIADTIIAQSYSQAEKATHDDDEIAKQIIAYLGFDGIDAEDVAHLRKLIAAQPANTGQSDDWHAGYREGMRDAQKIASELGPNTGQRQEGAELKWVDPNYNLKEGEQIIDRAPSGRIRVRLASPQSGSEAKK